MSELSDLLDRVERFVRRFVVLGDAQATAVTLWIPHTWAIEAARATPYLHARSAEPESGKTRLLEVAAELVREPLSTVSISDAALFRAIAAKSPTVLIDEVDAIFGPKAREKEDLRSLLNAGYRRGLLAYRMGGSNNRVLESFAVFCPKALAGIGGLSDTLASRCLRIELKRRRLSDPVEDFYPEDESDEADAVREWLRSWADLAVETLRPMRPIRIDGLRDRTNEVWRPLLAIAELAGGDWTTRARRAALELVDDNDRGEASLGLLLLADVRSVFEERDVTRIATADLLAALGLFDESPWAEWWLDPQTGTPRPGGPRRLAQLLHPYGIRPRKVRVRETTAKGYRREDFLDAWERFLPAGVLGEQGEQGEHLAPLHVSDVPYVPDVPLGRGDRFCPGCSTPDLCSERLSCVLIERAKEARA